MPSLFISHSSADSATAYRISERLKGAGFSATFLDVDRVDGIQAGRRWERELYSALRRADGLIFLASEDSVRSQWCFAEVAFAKSLDRPIFPVRLEPTARLPLLDDRQWIDWTDDTRDAQVLLAGLRGSGLDPSDEFDWNPRRDPYPGLTSFAREDAAVFFGREREVRDLLSRFEPIQGAGRFVGVVGPSGSGKSSLVNAGLLPRLSRAATPWLILPVLRPEQHPIKNLAKVLSLAYDASSAPRTVADVAAALDRGVDELVELVSELSNLAGGGWHRPNVLVVIDQAEELLTRTGSSEQRQFLELLTGGMREDSPLWAIATVRSEFLSTAPERAGLAEAIRKPLLVEPLSRSRIPEVIELPARRAGLEFSPGLISRMVEETSGGDALPLLAFLLRELYRQVGREGSVTVRDYESLGGVVGALQRQADRIQEELTEQGLGDKVLPTLLRLATVQGDGEPTSRRIYRGTLDADERAVVDGFLAARLLTSGGSGQSSSPDATIEVAHEALLRQWYPLREAIDSSREQLRMRSDLARLAADWDRERRDESYLLRGGRLAHLGTWAGEHPEELSSVEQEYVRASRAVAERSHRRLQVVAGVLVLLLVLSIGGIFWAIRANQQTQREVLLGQARQFSLTSDRLSEVAPDAAILTGLQSLSWAAQAGAAPVPPAGLVAGLAQLTYPTTLLRGHADGLNGVAIDHTSTLVATASSDFTVRLWDAAFGHPHGQPLVGHGDAVTDVAFSPTEGLVATVSHDQTARLWDVASGKQRGQALTGHSGRLYSLAFSRNGTMLATAGEDGTVRLWEVPSGRPSGPPLTGYSGGIWDLAFNADGSLLAVGGAVNTVEVFDVRTRKLHRPVLSGHEQGVTAVAFHPRDPDLLASASRDGTARLWNVTSGKSRQLVGHTDQVTAVAFDPDGTRLATGSRDLSIRLWDVTSATQQGQALMGHNNTVTDVAFSPNGQTLGSSSFDQTARLWGLTARYSIGRALHGHTDAAYGVAVQPNGPLAASVGKDQVVRLWDTASGQPYGKPLDGHFGIVYRAAFSPDGRLLATTGEDWSVRLWELDKKPVRARILSGHTAGVIGVAFSPDGVLLATASDDNTVRLWDVASGSPHGVPLVGHTQSVVGVAFSPDGKMLASSSWDGTVRLWDLPLGDGHGKPLTGHSNPVYDVAFHPNGRLLASVSGDQTVRFWDVDTGALRGVLSGHTSSVQAVAFSPDGRLLATASADHTVRLWDATSGAPHGEPLAGHSDSIWDMAFQSNQRLLTASDDRTIRLWDLTFDSWVDEGCRLVQRNLTMEEWDQARLERPYEKTCPDLPAGQGAPMESRAAVYPKNLWRYVSP